MKIQFINLLFLCFLISGCITSPRPTGEIKVEQTFEQVSQKLLEYLRAEVEREPSFLHEGYSTNVKSVSPTFTILEVNRYSYHVTYQPAFFSVDIIGEGDTTLVRLREGNVNSTHKETISDKIKALLTEI